MSEDEIRRFRQEKTSRPHTDNKEYQAESQQLYNINLKKYSSNVTDKSKNPNFSKKNYIEYYTPKIEKTQYHD